MLLIGLFFIYLAIAKEFEPMLLIPIGFGILIGNIPFNMDAGLKVGIYEEGSVLNILYQGVTSGWYPPLIFLGIGAMTDFSALISNPKLMLIGAAAQFGIFGAYMIALEMGFDPMQAGAIGIIGGADGPTAIFLSSKLAPNLMGAIAVSAYSYMALVPVIQPPIMHLLTTKLFCGYCGALMFGESGTSRTGEVHRYYKCATAKKHKGCKKKTVRKQWLEDLVVNQTMQLVKDDAAMESIIAKVMELQNKENTNIPLYEKQLRDAESGIQNMLNAIQAGILTSSTKERLEQLEETKRELEARIAEEKLAKPKVTEEFIRFWLLRFRKLNMNQKDQRQALVDTFINSIYLYDDKVLITFNYKEGTQTVTFGEAVEVASEGNGSDLDCFTAPRKAQAQCAWAFLFLCDREDSNSTALRSRVSNQPSGLLLSARFPTGRNVYQQAVLCPENRKKLLRVRPGGSNSTALRSRASDPFYPLRFFCQMRYRPSVIRVSR